MSSCVSCSAPLEADAVFCCECGSKVVAQAPAPAPSSGNACVQCSAPLEEGAAFCVECGARQKPRPQVQAPAPAPQANACTECGSELEAGAMFCVECGAKQGPKKRAPARKPTRTRPQPARKKSPPPRRRSPSPRRRSPSPRAPAKRQPNRASNRPLCAKCGEACVGGVLQAMDKNWHKECFVCHNCNGPFSGSSFVVRSGNPWCDSCVSAGNRSPAANRARPKKTGPKKYSQNTGACAECGEELSGSVVRTGQGSYHEWCFKCSICDEAFESGVGYVAGPDGRPCHAQCFQRSQGMVCGGCQEVLEGSYVEVLGKKYHDRCFTCSECGEPFEGAYVNFNGTPMHRPCATRASARERGVQARAKPSGGRRAASPRGGARSPRRGGGEGGGGGGGARSKFCGECGAKSDPGARFCNECGSKL